MADVIVYLDGSAIARSGGANAASLPAFTVYENTYDCADMNIANGDTVSEFLAIPAGSTVLGVQVHAQTVEAAVTLNVGVKGGDVDGFAAAQSLAVAGRFNGVGALMAAAAIPTYFAVAGHVQIGIAGAAGTVAKFRVSVAVANHG
jgi:hypothetical protein